MAAKDAILRADRSAATTVAVLSLCALALFEVALLGRAAFRQHSQEEVAATIVDTPAQVPSAVPAPASASKPAATALPAPAPAPTMVPSGLPPLPALPGPSSAPSALSLPPLPSTNATLPPLPGTGAAPATSAKATTMPALPPPLPVRSVPPAPAKPVSTLPRTGNAEVDGLIEVAAQSRDLGNPEGAMKALERADLILPDNPVVMRERALTLGKLGQPDKANAIWARLAQLGPGAGALPAANVPTTSSPTMPTAPVNPLTAAFGATAGNGPLSIGQCQIARDLTETKGEKVVLKVPVRSLPGTVIDVNKLQVDVFFFDKVDAARVEPTQSDRPVYSFDEPVDFQSGEEIVTVVYHMPELTPAEIANIGHRQFYGYVVKLYYQQRLMGTAAAPGDLQGANTEPSAPAADPATNGLLPPVR